MELADRQVPLVAYQCGKQFHNTFKNGKKSETYILAGVLRFTMNVHCSIFYSTYFYLLPNKNTKRHTVFTSGVPDTLPVRFFVRRNRMLLCMEICEELRYNFDTGSVWQNGI